MSAPPLEWRVPPAHPAFAGHFPGRPIVPGVVLLDRSLRLAGPPPTGLRWAIAQAKFLRPVGPGETLRWSFDAAGAAGARRFAIHSGAALVASGLLQPEAA